MHTDNVTKKPNLKIVGENFDAKKECDKLYYKSIIKSIVTLIGLTAIIFIAIHLILN